MQADRKPSGWVVIGAQVLAYFLTVTILLVVGFLLIWAASAIQDRSYAARHLPLEAWVSYAVLIVLSGALLAALQRSILRKWLPIRAGWLATGGLAMAILIIGELLLLLDRFVLPPLESSIFLQDYSLLREIQCQVGNASLAAGFLAGLPGGLLFGMAQAARLPWHRRLWWGLSALAWGLIIALALAAVNTMILLVSVMGGLGGS